MNECLCWFVSVILHCDPDWIWSSWQPADGWRRSFFSGFSVIIDPSGCGYYNKRPRITGSMSEFICVNFLILHYDPGWIWSSWQRSRSFFSGFLIIIDPSGCGYYNKRLRIVGSMSESICAGFLFNFRSLIAILTGRRSFFSGFLVIIDPALPDFGCFLFNLGNGNFMIAVDMLRQDQDR